MQRFNFIHNLFQTQHKRLFNLICKRVYCQEVAADLVQESYLRLLNKSSLTTNENLTGYLYRIAEHLVIDHLRQKNRWQYVSVSELEETASPILTPESAAEIKQLCDRLIIAINTLPKTQRRVLLMRKIEEQSYRQIAQSLRISEKTVQRHLIKALLHCHRTLETSTG